MDVTLNDVINYVASKQLNEYVGRPGSRTSCLVAQTIAWKYPEVRSVDVSSTNTYAFVSTEEGNTKLINLPSDVETTADAFDRLRWDSTVITRKQLVEEMPELLEQTA